MKTIFLVLDTVRRDYLRAYGNDWVHTPALTRLAERGVVFDNHWVGSLPCMPARREFMTGRYNFFDIIADPRQEQPLADPQRETHFCERLRAHLAACEAPAEQYERLGLNE